jgi:DNA-binding NarL/FixJ family response regulator
MRILCADNSPVSCLGISKTLETHGYSVSFQASTYKDMVSELASSSFDLVISELRFDDAELLDKAPELKSLRPDLKVLVYTFHSNPTYVARAASHQFYDFVLKNGEPKKFVRSVASAAMGVAPPESILLKASKFLIDTVHPTSSATEPFTKRELQILTHLSLGLSNREISSALGISLETVKEHVQNILRKLKSNDRTEAAVWALRNGVPTFDFQA